MTTRTHTDVLSPGESFALTVEEDSPAPGQRLLTLTVTEAAPTVPVRRPFRVGMTGYAGAETLAIRDAFPGLQSMRDFGVKLNGEALPSLTPHGHTGTSQIRDMPASAFPHVSFKVWDEARLTNWLDTMPAVGAPGAWDQYDLTYHHEPHGDYPAPWSTTYRARATRMAEIIRAHPNGSRIRHMGPVVTRWWLIESNGDPLDWWFEGATAYGLDIYEDRDLGGGRSWTPEELFGPSLEKVYAALPGADILVPEWGRQHAKGTVRAERILEDLEYLKTQHPKVATACYYNHVGGGIYSFAYATSPESDAFRSWLAANPL